MRIHSAFVRNTPVATRSRKLHMHVEAHGCEQERDARLCILDPFIGILNILNDSKHLTRWKLRFCSTCRSCGTFGFNIAEICSGQPISSYPEP